LVIGTICVNLANAIILTVKSNWRPRFYYSFDRLRKMFSFCSWAIIDAVLVWATGYMDIFFIGLMLNDHYLGLYKTSMITVGSITGIITASILPVVMPALAKVQDDHAAMREMIYKLQKYTGVLLLPLGFGIFAFSKLITLVLLGNQWLEAAPFIGLWGLMEVLMIVFGRYCSNIYPAIGRPDMAVLSQILHLIVLIPAVYIAVGYGFRPLYWTRSLVRLEGLLINVILAYYLIKLSPAKMLKNVLPEFVGSLFMMIIALFLLHFNDSVGASIFWCIVCTLVYFAILCKFEEEREILKRVLCDIKKKISHFSFRIIK